MLILLNAYQAVRNGAVIRNAKSFYPSYKGSRVTKAIGPINLMKLLSLAMELVLMFLLNFLKHDYSAFSTDVASISRNTVSFDKIRIPWVERIFDSSNKDEVFF